MRRIFKSLILLVLCAILVTEVIPIAYGQKKLAIGQYELDDYEKLTGKKISKFNEAPMLADLVKQGKLPPIEKRLPEKPLVVEPYEEV